MLRIQLFDRAHVLVPRLAELAGETANETSRKVCMTMLSEVLSVVTSAGQASEIAAAGLNPRDLLEEASPG